MLAFCLNRVNLKADKVYNTPVYRFRRGGEDHDTPIGLRGHILQPDFPLALKKFDKEEGWYGKQKGAPSADVPDGLRRVLLTG